VAWEKLKKNAEQTTKENHIRIGNCIEDAKNHLNARMLELQ